MCRSRNDCKEKLPHCVHDMAEGWVAANNHAVAGLSSCHESQCCGMYNNWAINLLPSYLYHNHFFFSLFISVYILSFNTLHDLQYKTITLQENMNLLTLIKMFPYGIYFCVSSLVTQMLFPNFMPQTAVIINVISGNVPLISYTHNIQCKNVYKGEKFTMEK